MTDSERKILVVANPAAGRRKATKIIRELSAYLDSQGLQWELAETSPDRNAQKTTEERLRTDHTDIIVTGGDGTLNEAINGLKHDIPLSILPAGTGNDYLKNFDFPKKLPDQIRLAVLGKVQSVDLGICNSRKFLNGIGIGFDGQIVTEMQNRKIRWLSGQAKYYYHVLHILSSYRSREYQLHRDGIDSTKPLILLTIAKGTTFGGGFKLTPHAQLDDGKLAVCEIGPIAGWKRYIHILKLQSGTHDRLKAIQLYKADEMMIGENPLLQGHIDGEWLGSPPFKVSVLSKALQIRM